MVDYELIRIKDIRRVRPHWIRAYLNLTNKKTYYIQTDKHLPLGAKRAPLLSPGEKVSPRSVLPPFPGPSGVREAQLQLRVPGQRVPVRPARAQLLHVCCVVREKGSGQVVLPAACLTQCFLKKRESFSASVGPCPCTEERSLTAAVCARRCVEVLMQTGQQGGKKGPKEPKLLKKK